MDGAAIIKAELDELAALVAEDPRTAHDRYAQRVVHTTLRAGDRLGIPRLDMLAFLLREVETAREWMSRPPHPGVRKLAMALARAQAEADHRAETAA